MNSFQFTFRIRDEANVDCVEIYAETLTEAVRLFLEGQLPDGELERCCDSIESFSVARIKTPTPG